jgi:O-antigen biosynthesis protein
VDDPENRTALGRVAIMKSAPAAEPRIDGRDHRSASLSGSDPTLPASSGGSWADALRALSDPSLDPLFWRAERLGAPSAWWQHVPFAHWVMCATAPRVLVELGTHTGVSYAAFCQAVARERLATRCHAVDTWRGDPHAGAYGPEILDELRPFHDERFGAFSTLLQCSFDEALDHFEDGSIDLLHIDGLHTYQAVRHDFESWLLKLSDKAVVLFHDVNERSGDFGVWRLWGELRQRYPAFEFVHGHGLGVLAVGQDPPAPIAALCELNPDAVAMIRMRFARLGERWWMDTREQMLARDIGQRTAVSSAEAEQLRAEVARHSSEAEQLRAEVARHSSEAEQLRAEVARHNSEAAAARAATARAREDFRAASTRASRAEQDTVGLRTRAEQAEARAQLIEAETGKAATREAELGRALTQVQAERDSILSSTSWRATWPARAVGRRLPPGLRRAVRGSGKLGWWTVTMKLPRKLRERRDGRRTSRLVADEPATPSEPPAEPLLSSSSAAAARIAIRHRVDPQHAHAPCLVYVSGEPDTPGHHYRVLRPASAAESLGARSSWMPVEEIAARITEIETADALIIWRAPWDERIAAAVDAARRGGAKVVFDLDDLMVAPDIAHVEIIDGIRTQNLSEEQVQEHYARVRQTMAAADMCLATTEELAQHMRCMYMPTVVLPNGVDRATIAASRLAARRRAAGPANGLVRIGYAGGSRTHQRDFAVCADAVAAVLRARPESRFVAFRAADNSSPCLDVEEFPALHGLEAQIEWRSFVPLECLPDEIARFDVNLAPLEVGNPFCEAKSELKLFEAALVDVPTIASPTGPFRRAIRHGETGFLAATSGEWQEALLQLVDDVLLRRRVARAARREALWRFGPERRAGLIGSLLDLLHGGRRAASAFALEIRSRDDHLPEPRIPEHEIVFADDRLGNTEVTVVMPLYNYANYVEEALESVRAQTLAALDLIVVDDRSTDDSLVVALHWLEANTARFNRVLLLRNNSNSGLALTRNVAFDWADSPWVLPLDPDNRLLPECAAACLRVAQASGAAFAYPAIQRFGAESYVMGARDYDPVLLCNGNYIDAMAFIARAAWVCVGGYTDVRGGWEDFDFWCKLVERGFWGERVPGDPLAEYRVHSASMIHNANSQPGAIRRIMDEVSTAHQWLRLIETPLATERSQSDSKPPSSAEKTTTYVEWVREADTLSDADRRAIQAHIASLSERPVISVVMAAYETKEPLLRQAIASVRSQLYPHWELCVADDASSSTRVAAVLAEAAAADARIKWVRRVKNGHIAEATNTALGLTTGAFVALMDHDDLLAEQALYEIAVVLNAHPDADLIYTDVDQIDEVGRRRSPYFKPDWNYDLFLGHNFVCHLEVYRRSLVERLGGLRVGYEGSQDYDLALRVVAATTSDRIHHIPAVLYHWRRTGDSSFSELHLDKCSDAARKAIREHLRSMGGQAADAEVLPHPTIPEWSRIRWQPPAPPSRVSIVVPTRDRPDLLAKCTSGVLDRTDYPNIELIIVDNDSVEAETEILLGHLSQDPRVRILQFCGPFNYSAINNYAVQQATGEVVVLLNNDTIVIRADWLQEMISHVMRPTVGAVGAKLLYADDTIQHAGVVLGIGAHDRVAWHFGEGRTRDDPGYFGQFALTRELAACTGACLAFRRALYQEVGGLDEEHLPIAYNDIDLCLRLRQRGYKIIWTPFAELYHLGSASRGLDTAPNNAERFRQDIEYMRTRWGSVLDNDPFYNPNFSKADPHFSLAFPPLRSKPWHSPVLEVAPPKAAPKQSRAEILLTPIPRDAKILEVGPGFGPVAPKSEGWKTKTLDHTTRDGLVAKYTGHPGVDVARIEEVDFVWSGGKLSDAIPADERGTFDAFIASHVIEHTPDFISFLNSIEVLLKENGGAALAVPDKRYCFDYFRPLATTGQILAAHREERSRHAPQLAFDYAAYSAQNGDSIAWGQHPAKELRLVNSLETAQGFTRTVRDSEEYVDMHAWCFVPASFELILLELAILGKTDLRVERITPADGCEFLCWLRRGGQAVVATLSEAEKADARLALLKRTMLDTRAQVDWLLAGEPGLATTLPSPHLQWTETDTRPVTLEKAPQSVEAAGEIASKADGATADPARAIPQVKRRAEGSQGPRGLEIEPFESNARLAYMLPLLRCPDTGQPLVLSPEGDALVSENGSRRWPLVMGRALLFPGLDAPAINSEAHLSNPLPASALAMIHSTAGPILHLSAGGSPERFEHVIEAEAEVFRHTDLLCDVHHLPFVDSVFAAVIALNAFEHYRDPRAAAREILRVLRPGGRVLIHTAFLQPLHEAPWHFYNCTRYGLEAWFEGFETEKLHVSQNFHPGYSLSWLASECELALRTRMSASEADAFLTAPLHRLVSLWRMPEGDRAGEPVWNSLAALPQDVQEGLAAGFELIGHKPLV